MTIEGNRWYIRENEFIGSFAGWVAIIKPEFVGNGLLLRWSLLLEEGDCGEQLPLIYFKTLEEAFDYVDNMKKYKTFKELQNSSKKSS